ncbi:MAG: hypothetical protein RR696_10305 [Clostridia bacterium]
MRRILITTLALLLFLSTFTAAYADALSGQRYDVFLQYYDENFAFIDENDNRHLLPLVIAKRNSDENDGRLYYELFGDVLSMTVRTDPTGEVIELCQIILTAPQGMEYGNSLYLDFSISGYHSYALLMAMSAETTALKRYELVNTVVNGMKEANGKFVTQEGLYTLTCTRENGTATLTFEHTLAMGTPEPQTKPSETAVPQEADGPQETDVPQKTDQPDANVEEDTMGLG